MLWRWRSHPSGFLMDRFMSVFLFRMASGREKQNWLISKTRDWREVKKPIEGNTARWVSMRWEISWFIAAHRAKQFEGGKRGTCGLVQVPCHTKWKSECFVLPRAVTVGSSKSNDSHISPGGMSFPVFFYLELANRLNYLGKLIREIWLAGSCSEMYSMLLTVSKNRL